MSGYAFKGWSIDGTTLVNPAAYPITQKTEFIAVFNRLYTVTFTVDGAIKHTAQAENGTAAAVPDAPKKGFFEFWGWTLDGTAVISVENYLITKDTNFIARWRQTKGTVFEGNYTVNATGTGTLDIDLNTLGFADYSQRIMITFEYTYIDRGMGKTVTKTVAMNLKANQSETLTTWFTTDGTGQIVGRVSRDQNILHIRKTPSYWSDELSTYLFELQSVTIKDITIM
jgi:hypothetical protein